MSYERHLGTPPTKTLKPISRKKTLFCVEYSVWWVGVSASMPVEFVDDFGWGPCECCWSLNLFWKFVLLSAWTAEALALKCDIGIVMMTSKLKLWIKKRYVRVVCDVYCLFCLFCFWQKWKIRRDPGSNQGPYDLQSYALPTELSWLLIFTAHFGHIRVDSHTPCSYHSSLLWLTVVRSIHITSNNLSYQIIIINSIQ